jgi:hypothetical protein
MKLSPVYVAFAEGDLDKFDAMDKKFSKLEKGDKVLTHSDNVFVIATVSSVNHNDPRAVDGPIVRVSNGEYSWRVDGNGYAYPVK